MQATAQYGVCRVIHGFPLAVILKRVWHLPCLTNGSSIQVKRRLKVKTAERLRLP